MNATRIVLVTVLAAGLVVPAGATVPASDAGAAVHGDAGAGVGAATAAAGAASNNSSVTVTVGQQLSTVLATTETEVDTEVETTAFEAALERGTESEKAEVLAERAAELREKALAIREAYREATRAYQNGELTRSEYAQRIAVLNARASNLLASYERLRANAANVSGFELAAAGLNRSALRAAVADVETLTGAGPRALLRQFLGATEGEVEVEYANGLTIEVESEDGERSREVERPRDGDDAMTVAQSAALEAARDALSEQPGNWTLATASVHADSGYYRFRFVLSTGNSTGEAEVRVDGSSGEVFRVEEEIEPLGDDESGGVDEEDEEVEGEDEEAENETEEGEDEAGGDEAEREIGELALVLAEGTPEPTATVTVRALADGEPLANATVLLNGEPVGQTGADGTLAVTLPNGSATLVVEAGGEDAELEFEFERADAERERREVFRRIEATASLDGDVVSLTVTYNGSALENVTVYANGERVGKTSADGTLTFATNATEDIELELVKGELEAELTYRIRNGSLVLEESAHEGDGDKADREDDEEQDDEETETPEPTETEDGDDDSDDGDDDSDGEETETPEPTETEDDVDSLTLSVVSGDPAPGATITIEVTADGDPVAGATVSVEGEVVGETGSDGTIQVTLPEDEEDPRVRAETEDASGRIEFDFEDD